MGFAGVEFAGYHGHTPKELRRILDDLGLVASSAHGPFPAPENVAEVIDTARTLGFTRHIAGCGPKEFETKEMTLRTATRAQAAADLLKGSGITFGMHNHYWEFDHVFDGQTAHALMMAAALPGPAPTNVTARTKRLRKRCRAGSPALNVSAKTP